MPQVINLVPTAWCHDEERILDFFSFHSRVPRYSETITFREIKTKKNHLAVADGHRRNANRDRVESHTSR